MGALITTIGHAKINDRLPTLPAQTRAALANALGAGGLPSGQHVAPHVTSVVREAFVSALGSGLLIGAIVTLVGAVLAWVLVEPRIKAAAAPETALAEDDAARELSAA
jgi:hypothetical protein